MLCRRSEDVMLLALDARLPPRDDRRRPLLRPACESHALRSVLGVRPVTAGSGGDSGGVPLPGLPPESGLPPVTLPRLPHLHRRSGLIFSFLHAATSMLGTLAYQKHDIFFSLEPA